MKKFIYLITLCLAFGSINAQVGINNTDPQATVDVVGSPADPSVLDGIIPPRVTGDQLQDKAYTSAQNGALIYVTEPASNPSGQTINVRGEGLYIFNANLDAWVSINTKNTQIGVGERVSVYTTMPASATRDTTLPDSEMLELEGLISVGVSKDDNSYYRAYIKNITSSPIKVTFAAGFEGETNDKKNVVNYEIAPNETLGTDPTNRAHWGVNTEILTCNVILHNNTIYEIQWMAHRDDADNALKHIYMTAVRKY